MKSYVTIFKFKGCFSCFHVKNTDQVILICGYDKHTSNSYSYLYKGCSFKETKEICISSCSSCPYLQELPGMFKCHKLHTPDIVKTAEELFDKCPYPKEPNSINFVVEE